MLQPSLLRYYQFVYKATGKRGWLAFPICLAPVVIGLLACVAAAAAPGLLLGHLLALNLKFSAAGIAAWTICGAVSSISILSALWMRVWRWKQSRYRRHSDQSWQRTITA